MIFTLYIQSKFAVQDKNNQTLKSNKNILSNYEKVAGFVLLIIIN